MTAKLIFALLVALLGALAAPLPPHVDVDRPQLHSQAIPPTSFLQAAPTSASSPMEGTAPMYDPLLVGMMGFFPFLGNFPGLYKPFFFPYGCARSRPSEPPATAPSTFDPAAALQEEPCLARPRPCTPSYARCRCRPYAVIPTRCRWW